MCELGGSCAAGGWAFKRIYRLFRLRGLNDYYYHLYSVACYCLALLRILLHTVVAFACYVTHV
jgi:hypothetical protein